MSKIAEQLRGVVEGRVARLGLLVLALALGNLAGSAAAQLPSKPAGPVANPKAAVNPLEPCCQITSIDAATGTVTAKVSSTGKTFQFAVKDAALLNSLRVGQGVFANFNTQKVSVDGLQPCCNIVSLAKPGGVGITAAGQNLGNAVNPATPCCDITSIDAATGTVTAKVSSTGKTFQFTVKDAALLNSLRVGQGVFANFSTQKVSVDGAQPCCNIVSLAKPGGVGITAAGQNLGNAVNPSQPCCDITSIDAATGVVTAKVSSTGKTFQFKATGAALLNSLKVGQGIFANFSTQKVSVDGVEPCCAITSFGKVSGVSPGGLGAGQNFGSAANPGAPCCDITSINRVGPIDGIVTAKVNATGQTFQFKVTGLALLNSLKVGQAVFANFNTQKVSVDGLQPCCQITSFGKVSGVSPGGLGGGQNFGSAANPGAPCCNITSINRVGPIDGIVTAKVNATGQTFQFKVSGASLLNSLKVGQGIFANFNTQKVSVDGLQPCCQITGMGKAANVPQGANAPSGGKGAFAEGKVATPQSIVLPKLSFGPIQAVKAQPAKQRIGAGNYMRFAPAGNATLVHLHGLDGIKNATGVPQGVRDFLFLHAQKLPPSEIDNYIVNLQLAQDWFQKHPEPDYIKQAAAAAMGGGGSHPCNAIAMDCLEEAGQHVIDEANRQVQSFLKAAQDEWDHLTGQAQQEMQMVEGCFADHTLDPANGSFQLSLTPQFPLSFQESDQTKNGFGKASGQIKGNATFGVPLNGSFNAQLEVSYIPCLPFFIRPKSLSADGTLGVGVTLNANLNASGQFEQTYTVPPNGTKIVIYAIPVIVGGVPIAEVDVSAYLEGSVALDGNGSLNGAVTLQGHEETAYNFSCDGGGCTANAHRVPIPDTATESVQLQGRIHLKPAVYAALQLDLDFDLLSARAGPAPYLYGELYGCVAASGSQSTSGSSTSQESNALTGDVDWGMDLRAEALAGNDKLGERRWRLAGGHLLFKDLAHSNALIPVLAGMTQLTRGQAAAYALKMPTCYPYTDQMEYQLAWTGDATPTGLAQAPSSLASPNSLQQVTKTIVAINAGRGSASGTPANCTSQSGQAVCWADPLKDMPFTLDWPNAGTYNLTITPVQDKHGRIFDSSDTSQVNVMVLSPSGSNTQSPTSSQGGSNTQGPTSPLPSAIQAAADLLTGSRDAATAAQCGTNPSFNCPNGVSLSPLPQIRITRSAIAITQNTANVYSFSATISALSLTNIPFSYSGFNCLLGIDTSQGATPIQVGGSLTFTSSNPGGPFDLVSLVAPLQVSGLMGGDFTVSGTSCSVPAVSALRGQFTSVLLTALHDKMGESIPLSSIQ